MTLDLDALEAVARAATPGPWHQGAHYIGAGGEPYDPEAFVGQASILCDAEHIAAFDPPTVLALIAKLREAEAVIEEVDDLVARHHLDTTVGQAVFKITGSYYKPTNQEGGTSG